MVSTNFKPLDSDPGGALYQQSIDNVIALQQLTFKDKGTEKYYKVVRDLHSEIAAWITKHEPDGACVALLNMLQLAARFQDRKLISWIVPTVDDILQAWLKTSDLFVPHVSLWRFVFHFYKTRNLILPPIQDNVDVATWLDNVEAMQQKLKELKLT